MKGIETSFIIILLHLCHDSNSLEEGRRVKKARAPAPVTLDIHPSEPDQQLERNNLNPQSSVPPGFLSPSVKEYLELGKSIPGRPGADYPVLGEVPYTNFYCENQEWPGFFADVDTRCQAWHYCDIDGRQATFLCPNGTQFSQAVFVCDWWFNVRCDLSAQLYSINTSVLLSEALDLITPTEESNSTTKERTQRDAIERERRLIPYMTFYLAHSIRNPNSGERQNVLIPYQPQQQQPQHHVERINGVTQGQANNVQSIAQPQRYEVPVTQPVTVRFQDNEFYPTPSIELTPKQEYKSHPETVRVLSQVYRFKSPGPPVQRQQPVQQIQQQIVPHSLIRPTFQQAPNRPRLSQKYVEPQAVKLIPYNPNFNPVRHLATTPRPQHTYTSTKLQSLINNPYLQNEPNYYKGSTRTVVDSGFIPGKVYAVNIIPQTEPKIAIQRLRPRPSPEKSNVNQIFLGTTTPSPYRTQVKFELEDARVPNVVNALHLEKIREPIPITYPTEAISTNYLGEQGQITEPPKKEEQSLYYTPDISQERPTHVTFVPVRTQSPPLAPETIQIKQVVPIQSTPVTQIDQIELVQEVNTPRPQVQEANAIDPSTQGIAFEDYNQPKTVNPESKPSLDTSVVNLLTILKQTNQLPQSFTPENIDSSIKTLALILERLQNERKFQTFSTSPKVKSKPKPTTVLITEEKQNKLHSYPSPSGTSTPGRPGIDYPIYATIPQTRFDCSTQRYKGFFGDPDTNCQVWHYCDLNGGQASFLCPNGTIFSQVALTCDWWFNVKCASTSQLYVLNERLYKYILPFSPSFPEDYSGPLVDRYLAAKFKEMEAKSRLKALKALISTSKPEEPLSSTPAAETTPVYNTEAQ